MTHFTEDEHPELRRTDSPTQIVGAKPKGVCIEK
jgi:hypothetical protein